MKKILLAVLVVSAALFQTNAQSINDPFFDHVDYVGAFGSADWTAGWCNWDPQNAVYPATTVTINSTDTIKTNTTWASSNTYLLNGWVYVKNNATLTIQPGTVIRGDYTNKGALIIERGSKLIAEGTSSQPIVFTSNETPGNRDYGDWGGVILCGRSVLNIPGGTAVIEGGPGSVYGGGVSPIVDDSSGILKYVRIEFPGVPFVQDKEINGLTMGAVGSKTVIDYVQVSYSGDDAYEWFGGTVNCKHLVSFRTWDDDFDTDNGYKGMLQYGVCLRDPDIADPGSGSNGFESDNDANGSINQPFTSAVFSNFSMFGPKVTKTTTVNTNYKSAMHLRRTTSIKIYNSLFAGYKDGLKLEGAGTDSLALLNQLDLQFTYLAGISGNKFPSGSGVTMNVETWFKTGSKCNDTITENTQLNITSPFTLTNPNFLPASGSMLLGRTWLVCPAIGMAENKSVESIAMYPNPSSDQITIELNMAASSDVSISIFDITGRMVLSVTEGNFAYGSNSIQADISKLYKGVYFVVVQAQKQTHNLKLIVQ